MATKQKKKKPEESDSKTPYPNVQEFLDRHASGGTNTDLGRHLSIAFTKIQDELLSHPGELVVVAQYDMPSHHRTEYPLANTQIALIPKRCFLIVPPERPKKRDVLMSNTPLFQIPVTRYVSITWDRESQEYVARRHQKSINLTVGEIVSIDNLYSLKQNGYGQNVCTIHLGNTEVEIWLIPATSRCYDTNHSFYSRICDAVELLGMPGRKAMKALDHFFTSYQSFCPDEFESFLARNKLSRPK